MTYDGAVYIGDTAYDIAGTGALRDCFCKLTEKDIGYTYSGGRRDWNVAWLRGSVFRN